MSCAQNQQILVIVDWLLIGVDRLQRWFIKFIAMRHSSVFEGGQHQSVRNQQSPKSVDSVHKTCNASMPHPFFSPPLYQKKKVVWPHETR